MIREQIITAARGWLGTPYAHQASLKGVGCDCLGLIRGVWRELYDAEPELPPPYTPDWAEAMDRETLLEAARRHLLPAAVPISGGEVILFRWREGCPAKHAGIATSSQTMIHAHEGVCVTETAIGVWRRRIAGIFSFPPD